MPGQSPTRYHSFGKAFTTERRDVNADKCENVAILAIVIFLHAPNRCAAQRDDEPSAAENLRPPSIPLRIRSLRQRASRIDAVPAGSSISQNHGRPPQVGERRPNKGAGHRDRAYPSRSLNLTAPSPYPRQLRQCVPYRPERSPPLASQRSLNHQQRHPPHMEWQQRPKQRPRHILDEAPNQIAQAVIAGEVRCTAAGTGAPHMPDLGTNNLDAAVSGQP
ncbi:hypothetical protein CCC_04081 [Paramagnetospirillum magnetotacticum MS-1]|uniref:Uncharacterized protein n=1 Tax=Paramagnetospirillum magnetotacticum MS-1 TaxID=272627 RepID=A0A0C2YY20_PARME|nr:hypothetical protein CCC_04081 [Paramagnetospirillum magnetotacticum MS-1]